MTPGSPAGKPASAHPVPGWETYPMHCLDCRHPFPSRLPTGVPIPVFTAVLRTVHCPKCLAGPDRVALDLETATTEEP